MILLPIFLIPARRMGSKLADLRREAAEHNASMGTQMTERFSAPGATLVKLAGPTRNPASSPSGPAASGTSASARPCCSSPS